MPGAIFILKITSFYSLNNIEGVIELCDNQGNNYFLITFKEEEMLRQLRALSEEDRKEIERRFLEIALKHAEWGK